MRRIIVDSDMGIDDALALLYLFGSPEARIEAITTVHGNVPVEIATANVFEVLSIAGIETPPEIAVGSAKPLSASAINATDVHGADGLGGWTSQGRVRAGRLSEHSASEVILQIARRYPDESTLLLIGPATNAALAFRKDPRAFRTLHRIVLMGGVIFDAGNVSALAEFNVYTDPEAANEVIHSGVPVTMVGLDVTRRVSLTREVLEAELAGRDDKRSEFLRCIAAQTFSFFKNNLDWEGFYLHDPLAAAVALDADLAPTRRMKIDIETAGELTRGVVVAERRPWKRGSENVDFCVSVDSERFLKLFSERVFHV